LSIGLLLIAAGLGLFARIPAGATYQLDLLPTMVLVGLGGGLASTPLLLTATRDARDDETGLASAMVNTALIMGGALGLAILSSVAELRARQLLGPARTALAALNDGYHFAFLIGAFLPATAGALAALLLPPARAAISPVENLSQTGG
jgi:hypothetical protein